MENKKTVGVVIHNSIDYVSKVYQAFDQGFTVVPLRNMMDEQRMSAASVTHCLDVELQHGWFAPRFSDRSDEQIALISFTSGTEGAPKGVLISFSALSDAITRLLNVCPVDNSIREYIGVPIYHSFGFGRCRLIARVKGEAFLPEAGFNPRQIAQMLETGEINSLSAVPSMLRVLLENRELFASGRDNLRWIEIGSQPMTAEEKRHLRELFPRAGIVQHYGLTEASRATLLRVDQSSVETLGSVGKAYGTTKVSLSPEGKIRIKGPHVATALLVEGVIKPLPGDDGWFETNDLGRIENGYLFFEGRADNVINCGGQKISAELIESALRKRFEVASGVAVTRIGDAMYGDAILVSKDSSCAIEIHKLREAAQEIAKENGIHATGVVKTFECDRLPATDTGKVQHRLLRASYEKITADKRLEQDEQAEPTTDLQKLLMLYQNAVGQACTVGPADTFDRLGLDSIMAVRLAMGLEKIIGWLPNDWRKTSISELSERRQVRGAADATPSATQDVRATEVRKGTTNENPKGISFWALLKEDFITHERDFLSQGFWALVNHRFGNWRMGLPKILRAPMTVIYRSHRKFVQIFCGIKLDYTVKLGRRVKLEHFGGMILGAKSIGDDVVVRQNTTIGVKDLSDLQGKPTIEQGVNIGTGAVIVGNITVGRFSVIGPNAVVDRDVPAFSFVSAPRCEIVVMESKFQD